MLFVEETDGPSNDPKGRFLFDLVLLLVLTLLTGCFTV